MQSTLTQTIQRCEHRIISSHHNHFSFPALSNNKSRNSISQLVSFSEQQRVEQQQRQFSSIQNKRSSELSSFKDKMLSGFWLLPGGDRALSRVDPFRLSWPDEFDRMARRLEEDMWRRHHILEELDDSLWRDSLMFFNNPERSGLDTQDLGRSISSSVEHYQNGKEHTFKRSVTVNGKTDTVTAKYDGEKTVVTYDGDKTLELPGFYDITVDVVKQGNEATKAVDEKLANMNKLLRGELGTGDTQMKLEQGQQQGQQQQKEQAPTQAS